MVKPLLDAVLPLVQKPQQYLGGEIHAIRKDHGTVEARLALAFPDTYEIGACNSGFAILYHVVNSDTRFLAERAYMPAYDMKAQMELHKIPLYALESFTPLNQFDIIGFTLQYELSYPNIPAMLRLSGLAPLAKERAEADPIIIAGGPLTVNPAPLSEILDAIVVGDGEEAVIACLLAVAGKKSRAEKLLALSSIPGVYVPAHPSKDFTPARVEALKSDYYPASPLVPLIEPVQNRLAIEVMRGCSHGCRFCSAGYYYRPVREREADAVAGQLRLGVEEEGWQEVSLLSLSTADYSGIRSVLRESRSLTGKGKAQLSLPSTRLDRVTVDLFREMGLNRRTGITFAPEAGSERLRRVINKGMTNPEILDNIRLALDKGFSVIKLYFMIGLPTETEEDIDAIIGLLHAIQDIFKRAPGRRSLHVSVAPFCPKPGTPFEREALLSTDAIKTRSLKIKAAVQNRSTEFHWGGGETAILETVLARGGSELSAVILRAADEGLLLQSWMEHFNADAWTRLLVGAGFTTERYTNAITPEAILPWDAFTPKTRRNYLKDERAKAFAAELTPDCRTGCASDCGACAQDVKTLLATNLDTPPSTSTSVSTSAPVSDPVSKFSYLFFYEKNNEGRFIPHHDMVRLLERAFRLAGARISFSEGFSPQPQMSFTYPLSLGFTGLREPCRISLLEPCKADLPVLANRRLPVGLRLLEIGPMPDKRALENIICSAEYAVNLGDNLARALPALERFLGCVQFPADIEAKSGVRRMDIRPLLLSHEIKNTTLLLRLSLKPGNALRVYDFLRYGLGFEREQMVTLPVCRAGFVLEDGSRL